jgi:hypothetical protein
MEKQSDRTQQERRIRCIELALAGDRVGRSIETVLARAKAFDEFIREES